MTITVTDVNEAPTIDGDAAVSFDEDTGDIATALDTYDWRQTKTPKGTPILVQLLAGR